MVKLSGDFKSNMVKFIWSPGTIVRTVAFPSLDDHWGSPCARSTSLSNTDEAQEATSIAHDARLDSLLLMWGKKLSTTLVSGPFSVAHPLRSYGASSSPTCFQR